MSENCGKKNGVTLLHNLLHITGINYRISQEFLVWEFSDINSYKYIYIYITCLFEKLISVLVKQMLQFLLLDICAWAPVKDTKIYEHLKNC